ncbi:MAG: UPF0058 family protein [Methanobrevibacter sp.]|jgi:hypothetical protein|nr:UPF0058 family protein [Candidatus Methanovirga aequatorialis]
MYKDEMIQLHQFLLYVLKYLEDEDKMQKTCGEYISLNIRPHHIHKTKAEHKHAIFLLSTTISEVIRDKGEDSLPTNVIITLTELVKKSRKELNEEVDNF